MNVNSHIILPPCSQLLNEVDTRSKVHLPKPNLIERKIIINDVSVAKQFVKDIQQEISTNKLSKGQLSSASLNKIERLMLPTLLNQLDQILNK